MRGQIQRFWQNISRLIPPIRRHKHAFYIVQKSENDSKTAYLSTVPGFYEQVFPGVPWCSLLFTCVPTFQKGTPCFSCNLIALKSKRPAAASEGKFVYPAVRVIAKRMVRMLFVYMALVGQHF